MEEINIKEFLLYLRKYILIIIIVAIIAVVGVFAYNSFIKKPVYTTSTTIVLVKADSTNVKNSSEAINQSDVLLNRNLVSTYRQIIKSKLVLRQVVSDLDLDYSTSKLSKKIKVESVEDTEILKISVTDNDPEMGAKIANYIAKIFSLEITKIYNLNNVSVIDKASVSHVVSNDTLIRDIIVACMISVLGVSLVALVIYVFDDTIKINDNLENELGIPIIAKVSHDNSKADLIFEKNPHSLVSESIRTLRTNLQFSSVDITMKTILITSSLPSEGKSYISSNLAASFAQAGKKVLLVDCDLRRGKQHKIFNVKNKNGLSDLLINDVTRIKDYIKPTSIANLSIVTRGVCPPNPSELLNSKKNKIFIQSIAAFYDLVIFDGAPCNGLSDSLILSPLVDRVVVVSSENYTPKSLFDSVKKNIENVGGTIAGCVINNINLNKHSYNKYYYNYESNEE